MGFERDKPSICQLYRISSIHNISTCVPNCTFFLPQTYSGTASIGLESITSKKLQPVAMDRFKWLLILSSVVWK